MRDYTKVWTIILQDEFGAFPSYMNFSHTADEGKIWLDAMLPNYPNPIIVLNQFRWYGFSQQALIDVLNSSFSQFFNGSFFIDGSNQYYEPKSGPMDCLIASPRHIGYNSIAEIPKRRK